MPVATGEDRKPRAPKALDERIQGWDHAVAVAHAERTTGQEVVLHVHDQQRVAGAHAFPLHRHHRTNYTRPHGHASPHRRESRIAGGARTAYDEIACARWS